MKKYTILLFILSTLIGFSQTSDYNYKFTYKVNAKIDLENENKQIVENMALYVGKDKSLYISDVKLKIDSARVAIKKRRGSPYEVSEFRQSLPKNNILYSIEKNKIKQEVLVKNTVMLNKSLHYKIPMPRFQWQVHVDEKVILGYTCQKATLHYKGRDYVAWFSNSIPLQNGPWKFGGLPGLIFEIADSQNHYSFKIIGVKKESKSFPKTYLKSIKTTEKEFEGAVENMYKNLENRMLGESKIRFKRKRQEAKKRSKPNPIELEK